MARVLVLYMQAVLAAAGGMQPAGEWSSKDLGKVTAAGKARYNEETRTWVVRGDGADIYGTTDSFQYVHQPLLGDGAIVAKVEGLAKTDLWAKAGVMIRESLDPGSRFAAVYVTPGNGVSFQTRVNTAQAAIADLRVATKEQKALTVPLWIKLERRGGRFYGYYSTETAVPVWKTTGWKSQTIEMSKTVYVGLAVTSHRGGVLCEAKFSNVTISANEVTDARILTDPKEAVREAYRNLEYLGNWRADPAVLKRRGNLIANSLFTIVRTREFNQEPCDTVLQDYRRIVQMLPETRPAVDALIRIVVLDGEKGLEYAREYLDARSVEERDRFYAAVMKDYSGKPETPGRRAVFQSFVEYVAKSARFTPLEQVLAGLGSDRQGLSVCRSIIQYGMAQPSSGQIAVETVRYMALKALNEQGNSPVQDLLKWVAVQFPSTKLSACATTALADMYYKRGAYDRTIEALQPGLFSGSQTEAQEIEAIESSLVSYRVNTLLQATVDPERIYAALSKKADASGQQVLNLHCQRKIAELRGWSLEDFERSALKGVKHSESGPENEVWFWKGLLAVSEGDLGAATVAYERFVQRDGKSILAARAYYDIARAKLAIGEDATAWVAKARDLSPCEAVIKLERRLDTKASARD
jgi:tetratricopeptide (TPR) repeat protein